MIKDRILEGYVTCIEFVMVDHQFDPMVRYTVVADRIYDHTKLCGVKGLVAADFSASRLHPMPFGNGYINQGGLENGEVTVQLPIPKALQPDSLLGQKVILCLNNKEFEIIPMDNRVYKDDPVIQEKNRHKAEKKAEAKILKQLDSLI